MKSINSKRILSIVLPLVTVGVIFAVWAISAASVGSSYILPTIGETFSEFVKLFSDASFYSSLGFTLLRSLIAFTISFILALTFALLSKRFFVAKKLLSPLITIMRVLPTLAIVLLLLFWTNSQIAPVIVTLLVVLPTLFTDITNSLSSVTKSSVEMCKLYNVPTKDVLFKVEIPQIMPSMLLTVGSGLSLNIKLMVAAEVLASTVNSLGNMFNYSSVNLLTAKMFALVIVTVIIGIVIEAVFGLISKKVGRWQ